MLFSGTRTASREMDLECGSRLYTYLGDNKVAGIGVLVHARHVPTIVACVPVKDRILALDIQIGGKVITFIAVYVPHCCYRDEYCGTAYEQLAKTASEAITSKRMIIVGVTSTLSMGLGLVANDWMEYELLMLPMDKRGRTHGRLQPPRGKTAH